MPEQIIANQERPRERVDERRSQAQEDRYAKLAELRRRGIEPFAYSYDVTHSTNAARALLAEAEGAGLKETQPVRVAGRVFSLRPHGKATFVDLADRDGRIQLFLRENVLGSEAYELLQAARPG